MNNIPRQKLHDIISQYGQSLCDDPKRCEAFLRDYCHKYNLEINVLIGALKIGAASDLIKCPDSLPKQLLFKRLIDRLYDEYGIAKEFGHWAVESWAIALNIPFTPQKQPPVAGKSPPHLKKKSISVAAFILILAIGIGLGFFVNRSYSKFTIEDAERKKKESIQLSEQAQQKIITANSEIEQAKQKQNEAETKLKEANAKLEKAETNLKNSVQSEPKKEAKAEESKFVIMETKPSAVQKGPFGMEFVYIPPGDFTMGSPLTEPDRYKDDENPHKVKLTKGFYMQTTEVTQGQWKALVGNNPSYFKDCGDNCPVESVSWNDVQEFIKKLNEKEKSNKYRLPTEAEWEYACRAGTTTPFSFGNCLLTTQANYNGNYPLTGCSTKGEYREKTIPVKSFSANQWGLFDMHGNVWEWCEDIYSTDIYSSPQIDPIYRKEESGSVRVIRGGSWDFFAQFCRSAIRRRLAPSYRGDNLGFRLARTP